MQIHLTGRLRDVSVPDDAVFKNFIGFVHEADGSHIMVLNLNNEILEQTIYHEFSHIIDAKLDYLSSTGKIKYSEAGWCAHNPKGFKAVPHSAKVWKM